MKTRSAIAIAIALCVVAPAYAVYSVSDRGGVARHLAEGTGVAPEAFADAGGADAPAVPDKLHKTAWTNCLDHSASGGLRGGCGFPR